VRVESVFSSVRRGHTSSRGGAPDDEDDRDPLDGPIEVDIGEVLYTDDG
jgi:hypothetical protein